MPHKLLTKLNAGCGLANPVPGAWLGDAAARNFLSRFADCVETAQAIGLSDVHSVPSVYAQPILFSQALADTNHPSHRDVVDQWRGLLSIFALQPWFGYTISYKQYPVAPPPAGVAGAVGAVPAGGLHLNAMLHSMLPEPAALWNPLRLILCDGVVVGAVSPWTMAFTSATPSAPPSIGWATEGSGKLYNPVSFQPGGRHLFGQPGNGSIEATLVHQWIGHLLANLAPLPGVPGVFLGTVQTRLVDWQNELAPYALVPMAVAIPGLEVADPLVGPVGTYLRPSLPPTPAAGAAHGAPPGPVRIGDVWLRPSRAGIAPTVVLKRIGMSPLTRLDEEAFPFNLDLGELDGASGQTFTTKAGKHHTAAWLFADELFFPDKLTYVNLTPEAWAYNPNAAEFSVPLTPAFFRYFNHNDVQRLLTVQVNGTGNGRTLIATLRLPIDGGGAPAQMPFPVSKTYSLAPEVRANTGGVSPGFVLWPDFYSETWPNNLAGYRGPIYGPQFQAAPLYAGGNLGPRSDVIAPDPPPNTLPDAIRIWECNSSPLGFALEDAGRPAGVILRRSTAPPANEIVSGTHWRVAVDFGTANTMVSYEGPGHPDPAPLSIQPRLLVLNRSPQADNLMNAVAPPEVLVSPFKTLCYKRDVILVGHPGHVYSPGSKFLHGAGNVDNLVENLKWGRNPEALGSYLKSLVRLVVVEARAAGIESVHIKWTYPLSLAAEPKTAMQNFWNTLGTFTGGAVNVTAGDAPAHPVEVSLSESEAASRALAWNASRLVPAAAPGLCVVMDIGGGSTDFGFWSNGNLLDYISCKLAANDVLRGDWLTSYPNFLTDIYGLSKGVVLPPDRGLPANTPRNKVEMWINDVLSQAQDDQEMPFDEATMSWLHHPVINRVFGGQMAQVPWVRSIRTSAYMLLVGTSYFAGLRAREFAPDLKINEVTVVLTGRGSSICGWISNSAADLQSLLSDCFLRGYQRDKLAGAPKQVTVVGSALGQKLPRLKTEVALGALQKAIGTVKKLDSPIFGEINWRRSAGSAVIDWNAHLESAEMALLLPPNDANGIDCYIQELIALLRTQHDNLGLDARMDTLAVSWAGVATEVNLDLRQSQIAQPVFAAELKALMNQYFNLCAAAPAGAAGVN